MVPGHTHTLVSAALQRPLTKMAPLQQHRPHFHAGAKQQALICTGEVKSFWGTVPFFFFFSPPVLHLFGILVTPCLPEREEMIMDYI